MFTYKQLEALYWVVKLGTFSAAAEKLFTTQSAITKRVQQLERGLDGNFFTREGKTKTLSTQGKEIFLIAEELLAHRDQLSKNFKSRTRVYKKIALGITEITAITWLPALIDNLKNHFANISIDVTIGMHGELKQLLKSGKVDVAFMEANSMSDEFEDVPMQYLEFMWVGNQSIDGTKVYSTKEIASMPLVRQNQASALNDACDAWLLPSVANNNILTINNLIATASLIVSGIGVSCLPQDYFAPMVSHKRLIKLQTTKASPRILYSAYFKKDIDDRFYGTVSEIATRCCDFSNTGFNYG